MNKQVYESLLAQDGLGFASTGLSGDDLAKLRTNYWGSIQFTHPQTGVTDCVASRDVHSPYEMTCSVWREIETEISFCKCISPDTYKHYCQEWKCEEKDVGQFSILFAEPKFYEDHMEGQESEYYTCTKVLTSADGKRSCGEWLGKIQSWEEVEVAMCRGCTDLSTPHCKSWECNEYEMKSIWPADIVWGRRLGMAVLHFLWIIPGTLMGISVCFAGCFAVCGGPKGNGFCRFLTGITSGSFSIAFTMFIITCMGFWRWKGDEGRGWTPWQPFVGFLITILPFVFCCSPMFCFTEDKDDDGESWAGFFSFGAVIPLVLVGFTWVCGLALTGALICAVCCCAGFAWLFSASSSISGEAKPEPLYEEDEEETETGWWGSE